MLMFSPSVGAGFKSGQTVFTQLKQNGLIGPIVGIGLMPDTFLLADWRAFTPYMLLMQCKTTPQIFAPPHE
jgi:hypothetical protein